jgi:hypothetical protein
VRILPSYDGIIFQLCNKIYGLLDDNYGGLGSDLPKDLPHPIHRDLVLLFEHRKVEQRAQEQHAPKQTDKLRRWVRLRIEIFVAEKGFDGKQERSESLDHFLSTPQVRKEISLLNSTAHLCGLGGDGNVLNRYTLFHE